MKLFGYRTNRCGMSAIRTCQTVHADKTILAAYALLIILLLSLPCHDYAQQNQHEGSKKKNKSDIDVKNMDMQSDVKSVRRISTNQIDADSLAAVASAPAPARKLEAIAHLQIERPEPGWGRTPHVQHGLDRARARSRPARKPSSVRASTRDRRRQRALDDTRSALVPCLQVVLESLGESSWILPSSQGLGRRQFLYRWSLIRVAAAFG